MKMLSRTLVLLPFLAACGTTGSALVTFGGVAGGPNDLVAGQPFVTGAGYSVALSEARLHLGAIYLNQDNPLSGKGDSGCVLPGIYVAQIFGPLDLDLLSSTMVSFPNRGEGTETVALTAEVWLLEGDIDAPDSQTVVLDVAGTATRGTTQWPFTASVTIGQNRAKPAPNVAMPGANPICKQRIVTPIAPVGGSLTPTNGGQLSLRVDPRAMFDGVDFSLLDGAPPFVIPDALGGISDQLFNGLRSSTTVYSISFH
jgi:hypothetical protein